MLNNLYSIFILAISYLNYLSFMFSGIINANKIHDYDLLIVSSPPLFTGMIGVFIQKFKSIPFWLDVRDLWPDSAIALNQINKNLLYYLGKKLESTIYNSAKGFIFPVPGSAAVVLVSKV